MSLHKFSTTLGATKIVVRIGWDRPLQGYFMSIVKLPEDNGATSMNEDDEEFIFNNLDQHAPFPKEINGYLFELEHRGIELPDKMVSEVLSDGMRNVGNKYVEHCIEDGRYVRNQRF